MTFQDRDLVLRVKNARVENGDSGLRRRSLGFLGVSCRLELFTYVRGFRTLGSTVGSKVEERESGFLFCLFFQGGGGLPVWCWQRQDHRGSKAN